MTIAEFIIALNEKFKNETDYLFSIERPGVKYTRVIRGRAGQSRSVFCFIDTDGNIYKPDGWKRPAKGVRSTLATVNISRIDPYGSWLYR